MIEIREKLDSYLKAGYPIIGIETHEEGRIIPLMLRPAALTLARKYFEWDSIDGLRELKMNGPTELGGKSEGDTFVPVGGTQEPMKMLAHISGVSEAGVFVLKDLHPYMATVPSVVRKLRSMSGNMKARKQTIVLVSPRLNLPFDLTKVVQMLDYPLPNKEELDMMLDQMAAAMLRTKEEYKDFRFSKEHSQAIVSAAAGMTQNEFENALASSIITYKANDGEKFKSDDDFHKLIFEEKIANLKAQFIEYVPSPASFDEVGGLGVLKEWVKQRKIGFTDVARAAHLPFPKGVVLAGPRGTGKTLTGGAIAREFGFPFFKLDLGRLFGSKVGESESNVRELIRTLEGIGSAVVLLDEIDRYLNNSAVSGSGDSGTGSRVFGTLLSWLSSKTCPVFVVATSNNLDALPPELLRKGRFDETYWVDLPTESERLQVITTLMQHKFGIDVQCLANAEIRTDLLQRTENFSGADIEALIQDAVYAGLDKKKSSVPNQMLAILKSGAFSPVDQNYINHMREKASKYRAAGGGSIGYRVQTSREIELN